MLTAQRIEPTALGYRITSLMLDTPVTYITSRSFPQLQIIAVEVKVHVPFLHLCNEFVIICLTL